MAKKFFRGLGLVNSAASASASLAPALTDVRSAEPLPEKEMISSSTSVPAFHSTLFEDFQLRAEATYNFYTEDEAANPNQNDSAHVNDLARYVELFWRPAPNLWIELRRPQKGVRAQAPKANITPAVIDVRSAQGAVANGYLSPGSVRATVDDPKRAEPKAKFDEDQFLIDDRTWGLDAFSQQIKPSPFHVKGSVPRKSFHVSFVDPAIAGALDENRINVAQKQVHLSSLGALSVLIGGLEVISETNQDSPQRNPPPKFPAPQDAPTLAYIGYVIERHDLAEDGSMTLGKTFYIDDPAQSYLVDRSVVYGGRYAYRMRAIVQWVRPVGMEFTGPSSVDRFDEVSPTGPLGKLASFYAGDWSDWSETHVADLKVPDPPDELIVRPISSKGLVDVVWKMPNDPQRDISSIVIVRCVDRAGKLSAWQKLGEFPPENGRFIDRDVVPYDDGYTSYVYAGYSVSRHAEISPLSEQIEVKLEKPWAEGEHPVKQVAEKGADPFGSSSSGRPPRRDSELTAASRATFYIRDAVSSHPLTRREYVVELQSLTTGERSRVRITAMGNDLGIGPGNT